VSEAGESPNLTEGPDLRRDFGGRADPAGWIVRTVKGRILIPLDEEDGKNPMEAAITLSVQSAEGSVPGKIFFAEKKAGKLRDVAEARKERAACGGIRHPPSS
jgi:hypothetical protein